MITSKTENGTNRMRRIASVSAVATILVFIATVAVGAQDLTIEMEPERATAAVAPVGVTLGGMPALEPLALAVDVLETEVSRAELVPVALPVPTIPRDAIGETLTVSGEQVFFNATLGGGSVSSVLGSINVFRIGEGPEFRIGYDHRASDGFNFQQPGSGYFRQENRLDTWIRLGEEDRLGFEAELGYADERFGLQRQPRYYSAEMRELFGEFNVRYRWDARSSTTLTLGLHDLSRVLAVAVSDDDAPVESQRERYYHVAPVLAARLEWPRLTLSTAIDYSGRFADGVDVDSSSTGGVMLRVEGVPVDGLTLIGEGATRYRMNDRPYFPAEIGVEYVFRDLWNMSVFGGYRVAEQSYGALWSEYPVSAVSPGETSPPRIDEIFFTEGDFSLNVVPGLLQLNLGAGWYTHSHRLKPQGYDETEAIYPVEIGSFSRLNTRMGVAVTPTERIRTGVAWNAEWTDLDTGVPAHVVGFDVRSDWNRVTGEINAEVPFVDGLPVVPGIGASLRYGIARDVELRIFLSDILAPLVEEGRTRRGLERSEEDPFIEPGFEAGAAIRVSF